MTGGRLWPRSDGEAIYRFFLRFFLQERFLCFFLDSAARRWRCFLFLAFLHLLPTPPLLPAPQPTTVAAESTELVAPL